MTFTTSYCTIYIGNGMYIDTINPRFPTSQLFNYSIAACIYWASELEEAGMTTNPITSLSWFHNCNGPMNFDHTKIWMSNVNDSRAITNTPSVSDMTLVYDSGNNCDIDVSFPAWVEFCFNQDSFAWDGHSNILIFVQRNSGCWYGGRWRGTSDVGGVSYSYSDFSAYNIETSIYTMDQSRYRSDIKINQHIP